MKIIIIIFKKTTIQVVSHSFKESSDILTEFPKGVVYLFVYFLELFGTFYDLLKVVVGKFEFEIELNLG